jgi:glyoxylase-like metal-dependent hydrolase (beta-lactamase superfamily II)
VTEIIPGVHVIDLGLVQAYLIAEADRLTLIDTGLPDSAPAIIEAIERTGKRLEALQQIVVTHSHGDHRGALADLAERAEAQVLAHTLDAPVVRGDAPQPLPALLEEEREAYERIMEDFVEPPPCHVDREVVDGEEIDIDGVGQIVHVPGHTPGNIAVYLPSRRALFTGDTAARMPDGRLIVGVFNVDPAQARRSFARLAGLEFDAAFFGHGAPLDRDASQAFRRVADRIAAL